MTQGSHFWMVVMVICVGGCENFSHANLPGPSSMPLIKHTTNSTLMFQTYSTTKMPWEKYMLEIIVNQLTRWPKVISFY